MKNYYEILEVDKNATKEIIKAVYKVHIKKKHPDLFQGKEKKQAEEQLKLINEAYEILSNEEKRSQYNKTLEEEENTNKELMEEILQENAILKELVDKKKYDELCEQNTPSGDNRNNVQVNYIPNQQTTEQNNTKYVIKLIWRERILRLIFIATITCAAIGGYIN